jgi:exoribonuclease R
MYVCVFVCLYGRYVIRQANQLVEEYMLLANNLVAKELVVYAGHLAFLRKHEAPNPTKLADFVQWCAEMGFTPAGGSLAVGSDRNSSELQDSIERLKQGLSAEDAELVEFKVVNAMMPAKYVSPTTTRRGCPRLYQMASGLAACGCGFGWLD